MPLHLCCGQKRRRKAKEGRKKKGGGEAIPVVVSALSEAYVIRRVQWVYHDQHIHGQPCALCVCVCVADGVTNFNEQRYIVYTIVFVLQPLI